MNSHLANRNLLASLLVALTLIVAACGGGADGSGDQPIGTRVPDEGRDHAPVGAPITYRHYPPASGTHYPNLLRWRLYDTEQLEGFWVHNLEHGGIVILYNCKDKPCPDLVSELEGLYSALKLGKYGEVKLAVVPNSTITTRLAVIAWGWVDQFDEFDEARITRFYNARLDRGPEDAP